MMESRPTTDIVRACLQVFEAFHEGLIHGADEDQECPTVETLRHELECLREALRRVGLHDVALSTLREWKWSWQDAGMEDLLDLIRKLEGKDGDADD